MHKQSLIECPNCHKLTPLKNQHRHLDVAIEVGITCQHCKRWAHFGYYTPELIERQKQLTNRRRQRAFKRDFDNFQVEVEGVLARAKEYIEKIEPITYDYARSKSEPA